MSVVKQPPDCLGYDSHPLLQHRCEQDILVNLPCFYGWIHVQTELFSYPWSHVLKPGTSSHLLLLMVYLQCDQVRQQNQSMNIVTALYAA